MVQEGTKPVHFLLVEDNDDHAFLVEKALEANRVSHTITRLRHGREALEYLQQTNGDRKAKPDLIILDLKMPEMDGHEFLQAIKRDQRVRAIPVVVLTTSDEQRDRDLTLQHYANAFLVKPTSFEGYRQTLQGLEVYWNWAGSRNASRPDDRFNMPS